VVHITGEAVSAPGFSRYMAVETFINFRKQADL